MAKFIDAAGREWLVNITTADLSRLKGAGLSVAGAARDLRTLTALFLDSPETFGRALWVLIEKQAQVQGIDLDAFLSAVDGPTAFAAIDALEVAISDFTQPPAISKRFRETMPAVKARQLERAGVAAAMAVEREMERAMTAALADLEKTPTTPLSDSATSTPAS